MKYINYRIYSDVHPYEVLELSVNGKTAKVRAMKTTRTNHENDKVVGGGIITNQEEQEWKCESNSEAEVQVMTLRKNGFFQFRGQATVRTGCRGKLSDEPVKFYDYNF